MCVAVFSFFSEDVLPSIHADPEYPCELVGTWNTWYGEQDQAGMTNKNKIKIQKKNKAKKQRSCSTTVQWLLLYIPGLFYNKYVLSKFKV